MCSFLCFKFQIQDLESTKQRRKRRRVKRLGLIITKFSHALTIAFYGIRCAHHVNGAYSPTDHPFVSMTFEGTVRLCERKPKTPKEPITPEILKHLISTFDTDSLMDLRFLLICSLGFFGFSRIDELLSVQIIQIRHKS